LFCVAAFGPSIVHTEKRVGPVTPLEAVHGIAFFAWLLLFIAQSILARSGNLVLHRRLGMWSVILAAALVVLGYQTTIAMGRRGYDLSGDIVGARSDPLAAMAFPLLDIFMFAVLFLAAYLYRRRGAIYKRLMLLALTGALMPAPIVHLTGHFVFFRGKGFLTPLLVAAFLTAGAIYDRIKLRRIHPVSLWIALAIFLLDNLCFVVVMPSGVWHAVAVRLIKLQFLFSKLGSTKCELSWTIYSSALLQAVLRLRSWSSSDCVRPPQSAFWARYRQSPILVLQRND
jgi:hypothetical protein